VVSFSDYKFVRPGENSTRFLCDTWLVTACERHDAGLTGLTSLNEGPRTTCRPTPLIGVRRLPLFGPEKAPTDPTVCCKSLLRRSRRECRRQQNGVIVGKGEHTYGAAELQSVKVGNSSRVSRVVVRIASAKVIVPKAMSQTK
jgi:hypothetical protein